VLRVPRHGSPLTTSILKSGDASGECARSPGRDEGIADRCRDVKSVMATASYESRERTSLTLVDPGSGIEPIVAQPQIPTQWLLDQPEVRCMLQRKVASLADRSSSSLRSTPRSRTRRRAMNHKRSLNSTFRCCRCHRKDNRKPHQMLTLNPRAIRGNIRRSAAVRLRTRGTVMN
jgi:hypothetical protein